MNESETKYSQFGLTFPQQAVLDQLRSNFEATKTAFYSLDRKAQGIVSVSSIIVSIVTGFQLTKAGDLINICFLLVILIMYLSTLVTALASLFPFDVKLEPIKPYWKNITGTLNVGKENPNQFYRELLGGYARATRYNARVVRQKSCLVKISFVLLGGTVMVTLVAALLLPFV